MSALQEILADLAAEGEALEAVLTPLASQDWARPTPAPGWSIAHQIAHLAWTDEVAVLAAQALTGATGKAAWDAVVLQAIEDPTGFVDACAESGAQADPEDLLARWRASRPSLQAALEQVPAGEKLPWFGPPMSPTSMATARFMETWAHSLDVVEALGVTAQRHDRVRHVVFIGCITRGFAFVNNGLEAPTEAVYVELVLPSGATFTHGDPSASNRVTGSAYDFALRVTQRRHRDDLDLIATGPVADRWLDIAQAFAGPPGVGRDANS